MKMELPDEMEKQDGGGKGGPEMSLNETVTNAATEAAVNALVGGVFQKVVEKLALPFAERLATMILVGDVSEKELADVLAGGVREVVDEIAGMAA